MSVTRSPSQTPGQLKEKLAEILNLSQRMSSIRDLDALLNLIVREAADLLEADRASIFLLDPPKREFFSRVALGSDEVLHFDARKGIAGAAAVTGNIINVADAYSDARFSAEIDSRTGYRTRSLLAAPMRSPAKGEIIGVFEMINKRHGVFGSGDEEVLQTLATQVASAIQTARSIGELTRENLNLWREVEGRYASQRIIGTSPRTQAVLQVVERIRDSVVNVLISGESGTGKDLVARALHYSSPRARRPLVALNCAALPDALVESELFGIEKGVATGVNPRPGYFEAADGGTLFLDEIGDLSLTAQAKILRALEARMIERVGGRTSIPVDVRVLSATNKDLKEEIKKGRFREDLYFRLKVVHLHMPTLREIRKDIPQLANHFLAEYCQESGKQLELSPALERRLMTADWPGNVRQLQNEIKRLAACAKNHVIGEEDFAEESEPAEERGCEEPPCPAGRLKDALEDLERRMIAHTMQATGNNQRLAAQALGLSRQGLINKLNRYHIASTR